MKKTISKRTLVVAAAVVGAAWLMPASAMAAVSGACANCHTMHNSQHGEAINADLATVNDKLLKGAGCAGCHTGGSNDATTGVLDTADPMKPPQVSDSTNFLAGGYFAGATDTEHHNVADLYALDSNFTDDINAPGGTFTLDDGNGDPALTCDTCHGASGHHSGGGEYRLLSYGSTDVVLDGADSGNFGVLDKAVSGYESTSMNAFCAECHGGFHGTDQYDAAAGTPWLRHPTDWSLTEADAGSTSTDYTANYGDGTDVVGAGTLAAAIPLGDDGTNADDLMCISCHRPHGSANDDMLRFAYNNGDAGDNVAGDATESFGCETCHGSK